MNIIYGGFWRRFVAYWIDVAIIWGVLILPVKVFTNYSHGTWFGLSVLMFDLLYWAIFHSSRLQATIGKRMMGLKVTDVKGERVGFGRAIIRELAKIPSALIFSIGFLMAAFTKKKQAMHDKLGGTLVLRR